MMCNDVQRLMPLRMHAAGAFLRKLALAIDSAMRVAGMHTLQVPPGSDGADPGPHHQQHQQHAGRRQTVHALHLVRAKPFYGYHIEDRLYIKVIL